MSARSAGSTPEGAAGASSREEQGFEPWAWLAFLLGLTTIGLLVFLGWKPGGEWPVLAYTWGLLGVGGASAALLLFGVVYSLRRRPVLQRGRVTPLAVLAGSLWFCSLPIAYPSSHESRPSSIRFRLPFEGEARVRWGGEKREQNRLVLDPARRFGTCFEAGSEPLQVVAPVAGRVLALERGPRGQRVVLQVSGTEFLVLEGLEPGSLSAEVGQTVAPGQPLGRAPALLFVHLQDGPRVGRCEGIPMRFWGYRVDGRRAESGTPVPPQKVSPDLPG